MSYEYEEPFRPNFEFYALLSWGAAIPIGYFFKSGLNLPIQPFVILSVLAVGMMCIHVPRAYKVYSRKRDLRGRKRTSYSPKKLAKYMKQNQGNVWYGKGFSWSQRHAQFVYEILKKDEEKIIKNAVDVIGSNWIHGIEPAKREIDLVQPLKMATLHTLIIGTTGAGKTRAFETFISQAVMRGEACIILDPKGDIGMCETARRACKLAGREEDFGYFHPAFPEKSIRINPLANFNQPTEVASRISGVIDAGDNPTFRDFGFMAINNIVSGLVYSGQIPTLKKIKQGLEGNIDSLLVKALQSYCEKQVDNFEEGVRHYISGTNNNMPKRAQGVIRYYRENIQAHYTNTDLEGLITQYEHDRAHFSKMITSTLPILTMLTSGDMGYLLSPDTNTSPEGTEETKTNKVFSTIEIINEAKVMYIGLDSLANNMISGALGSMLLADLASVAGNRYNFGVNNKPVNIFVDEASECLNDQLIQLLNKGRGSLIQMYLATQTISDFTAKLGNADKANQVLSNLNNLMVLRTIDVETQEFITKTLPMTRIGYLQKAHGNNTESGSIMGHGGNTGERLMEEECEIFPPQILGKLPDLEFIGKLAGGRLIKGRLPLLCDPKSEEEIDKAEQARHEEMKTLHDESFMNNESMDFERIPDENNSEID